MSASTSTSALTTPIVVPVSTFAGMRPMVQRKRQDADLWTPCHLADCVDNQTVPVTTGGSSATM